MMKTLKPTLRKHGQLAVDMNVSFHITGTHIINSIFQMLTYKEKINKESVWAYMRMCFNEEGLNEDGYIPACDEYCSSNYDETRDQTEVEEQAEELTRQLFPEFY